MPPQTIVLSCSFALQVVFFFAQLPRSHGIWLAFCTLFIQVALRLAERNNACEDEGVKLRAAAERLSVQHQDALRGRSFWEAIARDAASQAGMKIDFTWDGHQPRLPGCKATD